MEKAKKFLPVVAFAVIIAVVVVFVFFGGDSIKEHIEDTNGADNFELQTITDKDICELKMGALNVKERSTPITATEYYSDCFSGVYEIFHENIITNRYEITINHAAVESGNFKIVLCVDDEIVHTFTLNELMQTYVLENVSGTVSLRIAGESACFSFDYWVL